MSDASARTTRGHTSAACTKLVVRRCSSLLRSLLQPTSARSRPWIRTGIFDSLDRQRRRRRWLTGEPRNDWAAFAGPRWAEDTLEYARLLASRRDLTVTWVTIPPIGFATRHGEVAS